MPKYWQYSSTFIIHSLRVYEISFHVWYCMFSSPTEILITMILQELITANFDDSTICWVFFKATSDFLKSILTHRSAFRFLNFILQTHQVIFVYGFRRLFNRRIFFHKQTVVIFESLKPYKICMANWQSNV